MKLRPLLLPLGLALLLVAAATSSWIETDDPAPADEDRERRHESERLRSLPYAAGVPVVAADAAREGLTRHDAARSQPGLTLFDVAGTSVAALVENDGTLVHQWRYGDTARDGWQHVRLLPGGDLLAVMKGRYLCRLDRDGRLVWKLRGAFHHELHLAPDGTVWTARNAERWWRDRWPVLDEEIVRLTVDGELLAAAPLLPLFEQLLTAPVLAAIDAWVALDDRGSGRFIRPDTPTDVFHLNRIEVLRQPLDGVAPAGAVLVSLRSRDTIALLSPELDRVLWSWGPGEIEAQHAPRQLDSRRLLVFDNGMRRGHSRLVEVEPASNRIVWSWTASPVDDFYTASRGYAQRLPNGNTLTVESDAGRIFEIAPDGAIVWEYLLPLRPPAVGERAAAERHAVYRAQRFTGHEEREIRRWLATPKRAGRAAGGRTR